MKRILHSFLPLVIFCAAAGCDGVGSLGALQSDFEVTPNTLSPIDFWQEKSELVTLVVRNKGEVALDIHLEINTSLTIELVAKDFVVQPGESRNVGTVLRSDVPGDHKAEFVFSANGFDDVKRELIVLVKEVPDCDDGNDCTDDIFNYGKGECQVIPKEDGESCDDNSECTNQDRCLKSDCVGSRIECVDSIGCTVDTCDDELGCIFEPVDEKCEDDNRCTQDICGAFGCENPPEPIGTVCHQNGCAEIGFCLIGGCVIEEVPNGFPCEDGNSCTGGDSCQEGVCAPGEETGPGEEAIQIPTPVDISFEIGTWTETDGGENAPLEIHVQPRVAEIFDTVVDGSLVQILWRTDFYDDGGEFCDPFVQNRTDDWICQAQVLLTRTTVQENGSLENLIHTPVRKIFGPASGSFNKITGSAPWMQPPPADYFVIHEFNIPSRRIHEAF